MAMPYIGSRISLISKSEIRYEGILDGIDPEEHTVSLSNVKSFGTEGRRGEGKDILPSNELYETIIFRGSDIKDLTVIQSTQPPREAPEVERPPARPRRVRNSRPRGVYGELRENAQDNPQFKEDFDFESSKIEREEVKNSDERAYDKKKGFFDNISSGANESEGRFDRYRQKAKDSETFGEQSVYEGERKLRYYQNRGFRRGGYRNNRNRFQRRGYGY